MTSTCPSCSAPKGARKYLCRSCWFQLTVGARTALNRRDTRARDRLGELYDQIGRAVPLPNIGISP